MNVHATCVDIKGKGVLILGKPGVGKSSLGLQLMDRGAIFVADDQTFLALDENKILTGSPPPRIKGKMEVRGVGICSFPCQEQAEISLCVEICDDDQAERLPTQGYIEYYDVKVPLLKLRVADPLGPMKVELKLNLKEISDDA